MEENTNIIFIDMTLNKRYYTNAVCTMQYVLCTYSIHKKYVVSAGRGSPKCIIKREAETSYNGISSGPNIFLTLFIGTKSILI